MSIRTTALAASLLAVACSGPAAPPGDGAMLEVRTTTGALRLTNPTTRPVYYAAFERVWATTGLFIWGPCTEPSTCPAVAPRQTVSIPLEEVNGWHPEAQEALVYYWHLEPAEGGAHRVVDMQSVVIKP